MGNTASRRVNSKVPGYMTNMLSTSDEQITPVPMIEEPVPEDPPVARLLTADEIARLFNTTVPLPTPARTTGQALRHKSHETPSDYMATEFLKRCFTCKREFPERVEIFMYKDRSYCSDDCRNKEMDRDAEEEMKNHDKRDNMRVRKTATPKVTIFFIGDV